MNFQELGKILDSLDLNKKLDQVGKILEDLAYPKVKVQAEEAWDSECWMKCQPRVPETKAVQLYFANLDKVSSSLEKLGYKIGHSEKGILASFAGQIFTINFNNWIVVSDKAIVSVWTDEAFKENFKLSDFNW